MSRLPTAVGVLVDGLLMLLCMLFLVVIVGVMLLEAVVNGWRNTAAWLKITTACAAVAFLVLMVVNSGATAHDNPDNWIGQERVKNGKGELCCGEGDCFHFDASQVKTTPQGYVFPDGQLVPFNKAAPSVDKFFWRCIWGGETKCVFAPMGGA